MHEKHIKSYESIRPYFAALFNAPREDYIWVLGKPFGLGLDTRVDTQNRGFLKPSEDSRFVYVEETLNNTPGVCIGIAIANPEKFVLCLISDAQLFSGSVLEAFYQIKAQDIKNILVCVDYNKTTSNGILPDFNFKNLPIKSYFVNPIAYSEWNPAPHPDEEGNSVLWVIQSHKLKDI